jgi:signal transduction histidine kinase
MDNSSTTRKLDEVQAIHQAMDCIGCLHEGLIVTDAEGVVVETNLATDRILETPSLSLKDTNIRDLCPVKRSYDDLIRHVETDGRCLNRAIILQTKGGKRKLVNMSVQRTTEGQVVRLVHVFQDCADLRTMEERLLQSERLATVGRFASQIAHEIRNPLSSISLNVELLEDELKDGNDEARNLIQSVLRELDRLNDIVSEYLQFSRFPKPQLKRGYVDPVIQELAKSFKPKASVKLEVSLKPESPQLWLDDHLLRQALENLVRNGAEAIEGDGTVRIETDVIDRFFVIRVSDTGCGIPMEVQSKLFEPFFTTKPQGTGLGLATTQQIIFEHNGHLLVESEPGKGTTFTTLLPL